MSNRFVRFWSRLFATDASGNWSPFDDRWYRADPGMVSDAGIRISDESAQKVSAWYRGVDILSTSLAMLPLNLFRRLPSDEGREVARDEALHDILHRKPNGWQDSFQWRRQQMRHLIHFGNGYSRLIPGPRTGFADQLWPIHPTLVTVEQLDSGRLLYSVRPKNGGTPKTYTQDQMLHLRGASDDGITGVGVLRWARESLGIALATESYAGKLFSQGALHGGLITVPGVLNDEASKRMAQSFATSSQTWHLPKVLEQGATYTESSITPEDFQMLLSRKFSVNDMARWLGLPPHMLADLDRSTNNNIEHQGQEFVTYSLGAWLSLFESAICDQLILDPETYYGEFVRDAFVRGDIAARWAAYMTAVTTGTFTRNEVRAMENRNKLPGLDTPLDPQNITGKPPAGSAPTPRQKTQPTEDQPAGARAWAIVVESAARLLRKEIAAVQKAAVKHAADGDAFAVWVTDFYHAHVALVEQTLQMSTAEATRYCAGQAAQLLGEVGIRALEQWQTEAYAAGLASWALEEEIAA